MQGGVGNLWIWFFVIFPPPLPHPYHFYVLSLIAIWRPLTLPREIWNGVWSNLGIKDEREGEQSTKFTNLFCFLGFQAAALAACQFLTNEASRPAEPPTPATVERVDRPEQEKPQPQTTSKKPPKTKHLQKKKTRTRRPTPPPMPAPPLVQQLVEMGFPRSRTEYALKELGDEEEPRAELVVAWLIDHPDIEVGTA